MSLIRFSQNVKIANILRLWDGAALVIMVTSDLLKQMGAKEKKDHMGHVHPSPTRPLSRFLQLCINCIWILKKKQIYIFFAVNTWALVTILATISQNPCLTCFQIH